MRGPEEKNREERKPVQKGRLPGSGVKPTGWLCVGLGSAAEQPAGTQEAVLRSQRRQSGLQDGDLLAELCSKPRQPGSTADSQRPGEEGAGFGSGEEGGRLLRSFELC